MNELRRGRNRVDVSANRGSLAQGAADVMRRRLPTGIRIHADFPSHDGDHERGRPAAAVQVSDRIRAGTALRASDSLRRARASLFRRP